MTPEDWLACEEPARLLAWLTGPDTFNASNDSPAFTRSTRALSDRKLRLWACACCRHPAVWPLLTDQRSRNAVEVAERYADNPGDYKQRIKDAWNDADRAQYDQWHADQYGAGPTSTSWLATLMVKACCFETQQVSHLPSLTNQAWDAAHRQAFVSVLRATVNPFAPPIPGEVRTPLVVSLATAAYEERQGSKRECVECNGSGRWIPDVVPEPVGTLDCPNCKGTGEVDRSDGMLDPQRLAVLSDALEEAGLPEAVDCPGCVGILQPDRGGLWPCRKCGAASWEERVRIPHPLLAALREQTPRWRGFWAVDMCLGRE